MTTRSEYEARREAVASRITENPQRFDMQWFRNDELGFGCGTTYCIAGWALVEQLGAEWNYETPGTASISRRASTFLGIPHDYCRPDGPDGIGTTDGALASDRGIFYRMDFSPEDAALALKSAPYVNTPDVDCEED